MYPFTDCITKINITQVDNGEDIDLVMPMYKKISGSLWQYRKDNPAVNNNCDIIDFNGANSTDSFNFKTK